MKAYIDANRTETTPFDIVVEGQTPGDNLAEAARQVAPWQEAGATWWIEALWQAPRDAEGAKQVRQRLLQGPPGDNG